MIYLSLILILYALAMTYTRLKNVSTLYLYMMIASWLVSFFSYLFYLSNFNVYFIAIREFYNFSPGSWNRLVLENFDSMLLIRLLNGSILLFCFSFLMFSVSFTLSRHKVRFYMYAVFILGFVVQFIFYDPYLNLGLQNFFHNKGYEYGKLYHSISNNLDRFFLLFKYVTMSLSFFILLHYLVQNYKVRFIRRYTIYHMMCLLPIAAIHWMMFSWAPDLLVKATFIPDHPNFLMPQIKNLALRLNIVPILSFIALGAMIFTFSRYKTLEQLDHNANEDIVKKMRTASLGVKAFTHSVKNHLLAIRSEAEFLREKLADDPEALYSLKLILNSCADSYEMIDNASDKLSTISLKLTVCRLHVPVEAALAKLTSAEQAVPIEVIRLSKNKVRMDQKHITEVCYNIMINAIEALRGRSNGQITIRIEDQDTWGCIAIADNGPGIAPEHKHDVFSPFFTTKSTSTNWGVGLSYCHKIVTAHDGKIELGDAEGNGTVFKIFLPLT
ncbi:sensor histidine kinase [Paenibacillus sp. 598K]|uniref:sensor histidine kinase n=1 Tax=Paenibacillus sp. 598K TaxID=1117987 RepID=UPI001C87B5BB|nr:HAMP domain-containing sensor histidine kinase [Paenibacillus sp. 598K]